MTLSAVGVVLEELAISASLTDIRRAEPFHPHTDIRVLGEVDMTRDELDALLDELSPDDVDLLLEFARRLTR